MENISDQLTDMINNMATEIKYHDSNSVIISPPIKAKDNNLI
ncbi:hypothetical protein XBJ2_680017 [Xenorhabdus bovienii str. Jollieti]|uniref:Uncharacterized protein n=1 Tax=Xenorhabdus bovienii (strain SS-2004) TaxID=406818 RepID=D3V0F7_XENBS|nr:hypothetical protein XBJ1_1398 [Xenorhabdus bovienii SS-2004]CDH30276.1 hypothetical protein XBJ2_680017 [Xenorhabdus bovienii str. Jollieti]